MTPEQALTEISIELTPRPEDQSCAEAIREMKNRIRVLENRLRAKVGIESEIAQYRFDLERISTHPGVTDAIASIAFGALNR